MNNLWITYQIAIQKINYWAFLFLAFSLVMPTHFAQVGVIVWLISWAMEFRFLNKRNLIFNKSVIPFAMLGGLFVWESISLLWCNYNIEAGFNDLQKHIYFLAFGLVALFGTNKNYKSSPILKTFLLGCLCSIIVASYKVGHGYFYDNELHTTFPYYKDLAIVAYKHRFYLCTPITLGVIASVFLFFKEKETLGFRKAAICYGALILVFVWAIIELNSRINAITLLGLLVLALLHFLKDKKCAKFVSLPIVLLGIASLVLYAQYNPRMKNIGVNITFEQDKTFIHGTEPRIYIWYVALKKENVKQYVPQGLGVGQSRAFLIEQYEKNDFPERFLEIGYDSHSEPLTFFMELGIVGLLFYVAFWLVFVFCYSNKARIFASYFAITIVVNLFTENMLGRANGIIIFSTFLLFLYVMQKEENERIKID